MSDTLEEVLAHIADSKSVSEADSLFELSRLGQLAYKKFLSEFVIENELPPQWESLLYRFVPELTSHSDVDSVTRSWGNLSKVLDIIRRQGISEALYQRLDKHANPSRAQAKLNTFDEVLIDFSQVQPCRGLDVGTVNIIGSFSSKEDQRAHFHSQRNAFLDVNSDEFTRDMLNQLNLNLLALDDKECVIGDGAFKLANIFQSTTRRPMMHGLISPREDDALKIIEEIICQTIGRSESDETCVFTVPANPIDSHRNNVYHGGAIEMILKNLGFKPQKIDEGHAVILAEMEADNYTGIGISCGGGMSNICVSYCGMPTLSFSVSRGGDWIDKNVAESLDMPVSRITAIKEGGVDLNNPQDRIEDALVIYYKDLIRYTLENITRQLSDKQNMPLFPNPVELVLCGGTSLAKGYVQAFEQELQSIRWPIDISRVRLADDPLRTVSMGCLNAALVEITGS